MFNFKGQARRASLLLASTAVAALSLPQAVANAQTAQIVDVEQGATPFLGFAGAFYNGGTIASVSYSIQPAAGSVTRPLGATYSAAYLASHNYFVPGANAVIIPVFGLYAGATNTIKVTYNFTNGTVNTQTATLQTSGYTDPCAGINQRTFLQLRPSTGSLSFDYYMLKDSCGGNSPAIVDTDNNIRWVGDGGLTGQSSTFFNNAFYISDGKTGIDRIDLTNGQVSKLADYAGIGVTFTGHHNIDPGRDGLIVDVNTTSQTEAVNIEINPATGAVLQTWDLGAIISAAMVAGGDNPSSFVLGTSADWFHNNAVAYNPADNTLIVSSRENFVIAVDYDAPATGQRKIHWILGDTTKAWHNFPSLAKFTLSLANGSTLPPIGQHAVSIDHQGNLLLFDDGLGSLTQSPAGLTRPYSAARAYKIDAKALTATSTFTFTASNNGQNLFSPICGSVYDVAGNYLVDFATANAAAVSQALSNQSPGAIVNTLLTGTGTSVILTGVDAANQIKFVNQLPSTSPCTPGWNALPLTSNTFTFN
jgi:hypothetical protein